MSLYSITGFLVGLGFLVMAVAMNTDNPILFFSGSSFLLVFGGTLANAFISFQGRYVILALRDIWLMFTHARVNERIYYEESLRVVEWATITQKKGLLALDDKLIVDSVRDQILKTGIRLVVDNNSPETVRELLENRIQSAYDRNIRQVDILRNMAGAAPAFGMMGTLIGLIIMLDSMGGSGEDAAASLGKGLAVALLTTLYGVALAKFVFQPAADKNMQREEIYQFRNYLMLEGFVMLAEERPARYVEERIKSFLDPEVLEKYGHGGGEQE
jgi:chemotaxis protein MotA